MTTTVVKKVIKKGSGMDAFKYIKGELHCDKVKISEIVKKTGSPVYIYSLTNFVDKIKQMTAAFKSAKPLICYSMKANSNLAILKAAVKAGAGLDIVSGGELERAKAVKCDPKKIVFAGVGKSKGEIKAALRYGILFFDVESAAELELIDRTARELKRRARVSIRINPDVDALTHKHITTGKADSKFGVDLRTAKLLFSTREKYQNCDFVGLHVHIGSQLTSVEPFVKAFKKVLAFVDEVESRYKIELQYLNLGGGLGVVYKDEKPPTMNQYAKAVLPLMKGRKFKLVFEPGRSISAEAGALVTHINFIKQTSVKNFALVDAAMNDLVRPSLYSAYHDVWPVKKKGGKKLEYDIAGPVCESCDILAKGRSLQKLEEGDLLALMSAGAYGYVMASNYNTRCRPAEVLVKGRQYSVIKPRETVKDLLKGEKIPKFV